MIVETALAMRVVACVLILLAARAGADPLGVSRRLEAVQLGWVLSIEAGKLYDYGLGVSGLVRYVKYYGSRYSGTYARRIDDDRIDIFVGPRVYVEAVPDRLLLALGAGILVSLGEVIEDAPQGQPFFEAYAGVSILRSGNTELEAGVLGGLALDESVRWFGLAVGVRRRAW
jgi:hypothetical protein